MGQRRQTQENSQEIRIADRTIIMVYEEQFQNSKYNAQIKQLPLQR